MSPQSPDIEVFRTGQLIHFEMVENALKAEGIPFYRREISSSGAEYAMSMAPTPGPGTFWCIKVPTPAAEHARQIISELPVAEFDNDIWSFGPTPRGKKIFRICALITLVAFLGGAIADFIRLLMY